MELLGLRGLSKYKVSLVFRLSPSYALSASSSVSFEILEPPPLRGVNCNLPVASNGPLVAEPNLDDAYATVRYGNISDP